MNRKRKLFKINQRIRELKKSAIDLMHLIERKINSATKFRDSVFKR